MKIKNSGLAYLSIYIKKQKLKLFFVFLALIVSAVSVLSIGITIRYFVDEGFALKNISSLTNIALIMAVVLAVLSVASAVRSYLINMVCENVVADITKDIYKKLLSTSVSYFEDHNVTDLVSRMLNDTNLVKAVIESLFSFFLRNIIMLIGGVTLLFLTDSTLTMYVLAGVPLIVIPVIIMAKRVRNASKESQLKLSNIAAQIEETLSGIKVVKAFNAEDKELERLDVRIKSYMASVIQKNTNRSFMVASVMALFSISVLSVLWLGGSYVISGAMSSGDLVSFIFYAVLVVSSMGGMSEVVGDINRASGAAERVMELYSLGTADFSVKAAELNMEISDIVVFDKVSFSYESRKEFSILNNLSFAIDRGDKVAIVGKSGTGKTTIVNLLLKFYKPNSGLIKICGKKITSISSKELRSVVGIVSQDTFIFSNTAFFNISYGCQNASMEDVIKAAKAANIHEFIDSLPQGYNTYLGEKGVCLSGGQKQRVAIARVIMKNPEILILDEATSNLDSENERMIESALYELMGKRTTFVISHKPAMINRCNKIISLDDGGRVIDKIESHRKTETL